MIHRPTLDISKLAPPTGSRYQNPGATDLTKQFSGFLSDAMTKINEDQKNIAKLEEQFISGDLADIHQVLIEAEKAAVGLELTVQVRNKAVEAYQEIMRMQI